MKTIATLLLLILMATIFNSCAEINDDNKNSSLDNPGLHQSDTILLSFYYGMSKSKYEEQLNTLASIDTNLKTTGGHIFKYTFPLSKIKSALYPNRSKNLPFDYTPPLHLNAIPKFDSSFGLYGLKLSAFDREIHTNTDKSIVLPNQVNENQFYVLKDLFQEKYGKSRFSNNTKEGLIYNDDYQNKKTCIWEGPERSLSIVYIYYARCSYLRNIWDHNKNLRSLYECSASASISIEYTHKPTKNMVIKREDSLSTIKENLKLDSSEVFIEEFKEKI